MLFAVDMLGETKRLSLPCSCIIHHKARLDKKDFLEKFPRAVWMERKG